MASSAKPDPNHGRLDRAASDARARTDAITIRPGYADDASALARLAALDSASGVPALPLLVVEVDGELRVALSLRDGTVVADPFFPTLNLIELVRAHAAQLATAGRQGTGSWWRPRHPMARARAQASGA
jgi:hypothetical protein